GIATPNVNLSVDGIIRAADDENETEYTEIGHGGAHGYINTHGDGTLAFRHHGVTKMQLTDQAKLQVFGTVQSTEGGFQFPDGTIQTTAAGQNTTAPQVYIIPNTINVLPVADYYRNESSTMNGITGIRGGYDGKVVYIELIPSASGTPPNSGLYFESTSAEAENRIMAPRDYGFSAMSLHEGQWVSLVYDGTMERWRIIDLFDDGYLLNISNGSNVGGAYLTYVGDDGENKATNIYYKETLSQTLIGVDNIPEFPIPQDFKLGAESAYISNLQTEQIQLKSSEDRILDFYRSNADPGANSNLDHVVYRWLVGADGALVLSKKGSDGNGNTFFEPEFKIDQNIFGVNGQLGALQEFTLKGNFEALWADYVFDDSYELMPLYAIEEYIKANHHLPEMPTAADVQADGIKFSEVSILYLKKIEELTLHMIAMQKEIDSLKTQLQQK
ncbi:MAG TPA: hypothetical protein DCE41_24210, partial [Cytophagales bacterium]|nr:hypothetical protein [Cytophagales bacterium]